MKKEIEDFSDLKGRRIKAIKINSDGTELIFNIKGVGNYKLYHEQDCCEDVHVSDICGNLEDICDHEILLAEEVSQSQSDPYVEESCTWTFYKLGTIKGSVVIRWIGLSNGYYSERVTFCRA